MPKGTTDGLRSELFVMISNYEQGKFQQTFVKLSIIYQRLISQQIAFSKTWRAHAMTPLLIAVFAIVSIPILEPWDIHLIVHLVPVLKLCQLS